MASIKNGDLNFVFMVFVGVILAIAFLNPIANSINQSTTDRFAINETFTMPVANISIDLIGRNILNTAVVTNATSGVSVPSVQFTVADGTGTDGLVSVQLTATDSATGAYTGESVNISYSYQPDGAMSKAGERSLMNLIIIFGALAVLIFGITQFFRMESFTKIIKGFR